MPGVMTGLYHAQRGAHTYYLKTGEVAVRGDGVLNLIHYEVLQLACCIGFLLGHTILCARLPVCYTGSYELELLYVSSGGHVA